MLFEMMKNLSLLIVMILLLYLVLKKKNYDLASPCTISMILLTFSFLGYILGINLRNNTLKGKTFMVLFLGYLLIFSIAYFGKNKTSKINNVFLPSYFKIQVISFTCVLLTLLYAFEIFRIGNNLNIGFFKAVSFVKENGYLMNTIIRQGFKIVVMNGYISTFLVWYIPKNYIKRKGYYFYLVLNILVAFAIVILSGSRGDILKILSSLFLFYFLIRKPSKEKIKRLLIRSVPLALVFSVVFYFSKDIVKGFSGSINELNYFQYMVFYIGSPIEVLNIKLECLDLYSTGYIGYRNFINVYDIFAKMGLVDLNRLVGVQEFVYIGNFDFGGNVGGAYFDFISDFGYVIGMLLIFLLFLFGMRMYNRNKTIYSTILFGYFYSFYTLFFYSSSMSYFVSTTTIFNILSLTLMYFVYFKIKWNNKEIL